MTEAKTLNQETVRVYALAKSEHERVEDIKADVVGTLETLRAETRRPHA